MSTPATPKAAARTQTTTAKSQARTASEPDVGPAFAVALALTLALQTGALWALRRGRAAHPRA